MKNLKSSLYRLLGHILFHRGSAFAWYHCFVNTNILANIVVVGGLEIVHQHFQYFFYLTQPMKARKRIDICGLDAVTKELNLLLRTESEKSQLLSYDTTFQWETSTFPIYL